MGPVSPTLLNRFARLPRIAGEAWHGGLVRLPSWVLDSPGGKPYRPWAALWISERTGFIHLKTQEEGQGRDPGLALAALLEFGLTRKLANCRPERVQVTDEATAEYLARNLGDTGIQISATANLSAIDELLRRFAEDMHGAPLPPDALDAPGVTVERMRAFAEAAKAFYAAAPWRHLTDEDLVRVESPEAPRGLGYLSVLGGAGYTFGLSFYEQPGELDAIAAADDPADVADGPDHWALLYGPISDLSLGDADLWEEQQFPVAGDQAYPLAARLGPNGVLRPDAATLAYLEALLLALAETTEEEIDRGRWSRPVQAHDGTVTVTLCIPDLLEPLDAPPKPRPGMPDRRVMERMLMEMERFASRSSFRDIDEANAALQEKFCGPMDAIPSTATTPLEKAQDLIYRAFDARGRRKVQLARKALELSPDCADAYVVLAEQTADPQAARELYAKGVAAGERALGPKVFAESAGEFWGITSTRPYMRARLGLARCLEDAGEVDDAIGHYQELLRLNPADNQGVRDVLLPLLLLERRDAEAGALLVKYQDDPRASWRYGWALWTFRQERDSPRARDYLRQALKGNRHVPEYLLGEAELPEVPPAAYRPGSVEEAEICAEELLDAWEETPGAMRWLMDHRGTPRRSRKRRRR
ncbi:MAG: tetratricopeptide repeat protein [Candidatus Methylomirabilales bacterium]